jgi:23S rRNA pseudouridine1911/1915/1917 synthase
MKPQTAAFKVKGSEANQRLDQFLSQKISEKTRSYFTKAIKNQLVFLNQASVKPGYILKENDEIEIHFPVEKSNLEPADINLDIVFEDADIIVINKPAGMVVHPGKGTGNTTLVNALLYHTKQLSSVSDRERPGIIHRLDKNTSGLIVVAKNDQSHLKLRKQFDTRTIHRVYMALVWGKFSEPEGTIETMIDRSKKDPTKRSVALRGKRAVTHYKVIQEFGYASLVEVILETGRTHQIRVHMTFIHHPVIGDPEYSGRDSQLKRLPVNLKKRGKHLLEILPHQALHARKISFIHPTSAKLVEFECEPPEYFAEALRKLPNLFLLNS